MTVSTENAKQKSSTVRLLTAKEFKDAKGLKGQEAKKAYNAYIRENGSANTAGLMAACSSGEYLVKKVKRYGKTGNLDVSFILKAGLKDPEAKPVEAAAPAVLQELANLKALLASIGATPEMMAAAAAMGTPAAPAAPAPAA